MHVFLWQAVIVTFPKSTFPFPLLKELLFSFEQKCALLKICPSQRFLDLVFPWGPHLACETAMASLGQAWEKILFFSARDWLRSMGLCPFANFPPLFLGGNMAVLRLWTDATYLVAVSTKLDRAFVLKELSEQLCQPWAAKLCTL